METTTRRLSPRDESDLSWFHTLAPGEVSAVKAQCYDPRIGGDMTDNGAAIARVLSSRSIAFSSRYRAVERARDHLLRMPGGAGLWGYLRLAYSDPLRTDPHTLFGDHPISGRLLMNNTNPHPAASLARYTPTAQSLAVRNAERGEHDRIVRAAYESAREAMRDENASPISLTEAVLRRDATLDVTVTMDAVLAEAGRLIEAMMKARRKDDAAQAFCQAVKSEALEMWEAASVGYATARLAATPKKTVDKKLPMGWADDRERYRQEILARVFAVVDRDHRHASDERVAAAE